MKIIYSDHAKQNMVERRISNKEVETTILNPEKLTDSKKGRIIAQKTIGNRILRVVYKETEKVYIIVTLYYTKVGRY